MNSPTLRTFSDLLQYAALRAPQKIALVTRQGSMTYAQYAQQAWTLAQALFQLSGSAQSKGARVGIWIEKRCEVAISIFATARAGLTFVPINPILKPPQLAHILSNCQVKTLITTTQRLEQILHILDSLTNLEHIIIVGTVNIALRDRLPEAVRVHHWDELLQKAGSAALHHQTPKHVYDTSDLTAILYTSGSTGYPKGVAISHGNLLTGALSVCQSLGILPGDKIFSVLPLSFDAGLNQLATACVCQATVVLHNHIHSHHTLTQIVNQRVSVIIGVPPLWLQLIGNHWQRYVQPETIETLRVIANTGGQLPVTVIKAIQKHLPKTEIHLMYGLTEAFRSTTLSPKQIQKRPDSIGKPIPHAEIFVLNKDEKLCKPGESGELIHRGPLVTLGYWNDSSSTRQRYRPIPPAIAEQIQYPGQDEKVVFSGDIVQYDSEGYLYFVGRKDDIIKSSGYRVNPFEIEGAIYATGMVAETAAIGVAHPLKGQAIVVIAVSADPVQRKTKALLEACRLQLPSYMVPQHIQWLSQSLPRNANGKIDRQLLREEYSYLFQS